MYYYVSRPEVSVFIGSSVECASVWSGIFWGAQADNINIYTAIAIKIRMILLRFAIYTLTSGLLT